MSRKRHPDFPHDLTADDRKAGGFARAAKLTPERRREIAILANQARFGKKTRKKKKVEAAA